MASDKDRNPYLPKKARVIGNALRKDARLQVDIEAEYRIEGVKKNIPCRVIDISTFGLGIQIKAFMASGDKLAIMLTLGEEKMELPCEVVHVYGKSIGLKYSSVSEKDQEFLRSYVHKHFFDRPKNKP